MRKIKLISIILVIIIFGLTACKASDPTNGKTPDPSAITAKIIGQGGFVELKQFTDEKLLHYYSTVDMSLTQNFSVLICVSNASADELAVFKMKDVSDVSKINDSIKQRIKDQQDTFRNYNVGQKPKLQKYTLKSCGPYVLFVVSDNNQKVEKTFDEFFK